MDNIILIGMPGSGKSTVGVVLAKTLGLRFVDVDLLIQEREGALLQELIDTRGVERFLDLERDAICSLESRGQLRVPGGVRRPYAAAGDGGLSPAVPRGRGGAHSQPGVPGHCPLPRPRPGRRVPVPGPTV